MKQLYLILLLLLPLGLFAQNWKTVSDKDTVYFMGGKHHDVEHFGLDSGISKVILVDSSRQVNGDSIFYFFRCIRKLDYNSCLDTFAPCWLGPMLIRRQNGTEYYFNSFYDTITIKTAANVGDSWILAADTSGVVYKGTVVQNGTEIIDGNSDSIKTIAIQAYNNVTPVFSSYNNLELKLSKNHGWLKTLDFYRFPNNVIGLDGFATVIDTGQLARIDKTLFGTNGYLIDLQWKYMPGNEWICDSSWGVAPAIGADKIFLHDSVVSSVPITIDTIVATLKSDRYFINWFFVAGPPYPHWESQVSTNSWYHTDTIVTTVLSQPANNFPVLPERKEKSMQNYEQLHPGLFSRWFMDTICSKIIARYAYVGGYFITKDSNNCWKEMPGVSGYTYSTSASLSSFGPFANHYEFGDYIGMPDSYSDSYLSYLKLNGCTWGTKINVIALGINDVETPECTIYPNPAKETVYIKIPGDNSADIELHDITGRLLQKTVGRPPTAELSIAAYSPGIYILSINSSGTISNYKLQID